MCRFFEIAKNRMGLRSRIWVMRFFDCDFCCLVIAILRFLRLRSSRFPGSISNRRYFAFHSFCWHNAAKPIPIGIMSTQAHRKYQKCDFHYKFTPTMLQTVLQVAGHARQAAAADGLWHNRAVCRRIFAGNCAQARCVECQVGFQMK